MIRSCRSCYYYDAEHHKMYDEMICTKGDMRIRLKPGQAKPDDCPLKREKDRHGTYYDIQGIKEAQDRSCNI